ncbi:Protein of unknown function (DUF3089) [Sphaerochaeta pleomorpha str. Grapes]|uniref:DUF3089 domain-containing protein n=1 Tax=Sphaerochaeta pleomorpha (strain ATCC BAA-1885 / DSM 22778 / Grapes) TaxID=158190 RepID=G8QVQ6_SPHPG|nr:DUF3089 domain-containing protein [Sphaerochaeta pleomorpha]AEV29348.1 Protein of unknown function (DUF3089) [Sphaerochaeta pleomorpha str. Grapes]
MNKQRISPLAMLLFCLPLLFWGCSTTKALPPSAYANPDNWLSLPTDGKKEVDVFYLYPTVWAKAHQDEPIFPSIDNEMMHSGAKMAFLLQASAFESVGNIYAPYYRQLDAAYVLALPPEERHSALETVPVTDAVAAFDYYIQHYSKGKPFILAGHSQGSDVLLLLLSSYMKDHPEVAARMVAAYCIGCSVTEDFLQENPHLTFAQGSDDLGVIISYNTEGPSIEGPNPVVLPGALAINPITWTRGEQHAPADENQGSLMLGKDGKPVTLPSFADAQVSKQRGVVVCTTVSQALPTLASSALFPKGVYHSFDYSLYYFNIQKNAENRAKLFLQR